MLCYQNEPWHDKGKEALSSLKEELRERGAPLRVPGRGPPVERKAELQREGETAWGRVLRSQKPRVLSPYSHLKL